MGKFYKRYENYKSCLGTLNECKKRELESKQDKIVLSGIISHFCLTFDLSWKCMKDLITEYYGLNDFSLGSPRESIEKGFSLGLIDDETGWIRVMKLRNELTHDYNSILAIDECHNILYNYINLFNNLENKIDNLIKEKNI